MSPGSAGLGTKILRIIWDNDDKSREERKFVHKLDSVLLTTAMLGYFVKYLSQANISNAYASGMKEDLNIVGDEYNLILTMFTVGYVIGTFPGTLAMVRFSPSVWLPACEVIWTVLVMCCAVAKNVQTLYALRFLIGLLEATAYPGMLWVLGSWYGPAELGKRVVMFQATSSVGTMFSGYLQAAVYHGLNGRHSLKGWQWLMIIDGCICLPIAIAGFFLIPDTPSKFNPRLKWYFSPADMEMANARTLRWGRAPNKGLNLRQIKQVFSNWSPYAFFIPYTCFVVGLGSYAYMNLWLKATPGYNDVTSINLIPTGGYGISIFMSLAYSWTSDALGTRWPVMLFGGIPPLIGNIILAAWPPGNSAKFAGFFLNFTATSIGALMLAWVNELLSGSAEARAIMTGFLNTGAYAVNAWAPNLIFPASRAPHYPAGYKVTAAFFAVWIISIPTILILQQSFPITKFRDEYEADILAGNIESFEREGAKGDDSSESGVSVPLGVAVAAQSEATATRP